MPSDAPVAFVDCETTGLDPDRHGIWEVALIRGDEERVWQLPVDLRAADPAAAAVNGMHERYDLGSLTPHPDFAQEFYRLTSPAAIDGEPQASLKCHLVGAVVSFDEERLRRLLLSQGHAPWWHYHIVDVEALAAGRVAGTGWCPEFNPARAAAIAAPPWDSEELSRAVGVSPDRFDRHTALGDARWARAVYEAVIDPTMTKETRRA